MAEYTRMENSNGDRTASWGTSNQVEKEKYETPKTSMLLINIYIHILLKLNVCDLPETINTFEN